MFSKFLLTALIVTVAFFVIRQRNVVDSTDRVASGNPEAAPGKSKDSEIRFVAYAFLAMIVMLALGIYYFQWQDDHQLLTVTLHSDNQSSPLSYQVYKYQLGDRSFTTIDGISITVASTERMEVSGLED